MHQKGIKPYNKGFLKNIFLFLKRVFGRNSIKDEKHTYFVVVVEKTRFQRNEWMK
jgi:hypothetical protein